MIGVRGLVCASALALIGSIGASDAASAGVGQGRASDSLQAALPEVGTEALEDFWRVAPGLKLTLSSALDADYDRDEHGDAERLHQLNNKTRVRLDASPLPDLELSGRITMRSRGLLSDDDSVAVMTASVRANYRLGRAKIGLRYDPAPLYHSLGKSKASRLGVDFTLRKKSLLGFKVADRLELRRLASEALDGGGTRLTLARELRKSVSLEGGRVSKLRITPAMRYERWADAESARSLALSLEASYDRPVGAGFKLSADTKLSREALTTDLHRAAEPAFEAAARLNLSTQF